MVFFLTLLPFYSIRDAAFTEQTDPSSGAAAPARGSSSPHAASSSDRDPAAGREPASDAASKGAGGSGQTPSDVDPSQKKQPAVSGDRAARAWLGLLWSGLATFDRLLRTL